MTAVEDDLGLWKTGEFPLKSLVLTIGAALLVVVLAVHWGGATGGGRLLAVFAPAISFILILALPSYRPLRGDRHLLLPAVLILGALLVVACSPLPALGRLEWREIVSYSLLLAAFLLIRPPDPARLFFYLASLSLGAALIIYGLGRRGGPLFPAPPLTATYLNRNHFAALLGMIFPAALAFSLSSRPRRVAWLSRAGLPVLLAGIVLTRSRGALLAAFPAGIAVVSVFFYGRSRRNRRAKTAVVLVIALGLLAAAGAVVLAPREPVPELYSTSLDTLSIQTRISIWRSTLDMFLSRPFFGWGWGTFRHIYPGYKEPGVWYVVPHAHNDFLQLLAEGGAAGFLIIISGLAWTLVRLGKNYLSSPRSVSGIFALGAAGALVYASVHSGFDFILRLPANVIFLVSLVGLGLASAPPGGGFAIRRRWARLSGSLAAIAVIVLILLVPSLRFYRSEAMTREGERLLGSGMTREAREIFSRAHRLDPSAVRPLLGRAAAGIADFDRAEDPVSSYSSILADLNTARRNNPRDIRPPRRLSRFHRRLSAFEEAGSYLEAALVLDPVNPFLYYELAENDLSRGASLSAARRLRRATEIYPMIWGDARRLLFSHTGDYEILKELPPREGLFHRRMGYQLLGEENLPAAEAEFSKARALEPDESENLRALGLCSARAGRLPEAAEYYREALDREPDRHQWLAELGDILRDLDSPAEALDLYLRARALAPGRRRYAEKAGTTILFLQGPAAAIDFWGEAAAGEPEWSRPYYLRARLFLETGRPAEAEREIDLAISRQPGNRYYAKLKSRIETTLNRKDTQ